METLTVVSVTIIAAVLCIDLVWKIAKEVRNRHRMKMLRQDAMDENERSSQLEKRLDRFEKNFSKQVDKKIDEKIDTLGDKIDGLSDCLGYKLRSCCKKTSSAMDDDLCECDDNGMIYDEDEDSPETDGSVEMDDVMGAYFMD